MSRVGRGYRGMGSPTTVGCCSRGMAPRGRRLPGARVASGTRRFLPLIVLVPARYPLRLRAACAQAAAEDILGQDRLGDAGDSRYFDALPAFAFMRSARSLDPGCEEVMLPFPPSSFSNLRNADSIALKSYLCFFMN